MRRWAKIGIVFTLLATCCIGISRLPIFRNKNWPFSDKGDIHVSIKHRGNPTNVLPIERAFHDTVDVWLDGRLQGKGVGYCGKVTITITAPEGIDVMPFQWYMNLTEQRHWLNTPVAIHVACDLPRGKYRVRVDVEADPPPKGDTFNQGELTIIVE